VARSGLRRVAAVVHDSFPERLAAISILGIASRITERLPLIGWIVHLKRYF
jgi:IclR family acetate operon transcriptional repressor